MKIIRMALLLIILSACGQNKIPGPEKIKKISIHIFSSGDKDGPAVNWYYIRNRNVYGQQGYYFESQKPLEDFNNANFVYYDSKPDKFKESYPLKEKIILMNPEDLPANVQQSLADLESISVGE